MKRLPRIGFSTNVFDNPFDVVGHLEFLANYFDVIELEIAEEAQNAIFNSSPTSYDEIVAGVRRVVDERGLTLSVHAAWFGRHTNQAASDPDEREAATALLRRSVRFAGDVGVSCVTYHPGLRKDLDNAALMANLQRSLERIVPFAHEHGVFLCLENMGAERPAFAVFTPEEHVRLCRTTGTALTLDVVHLATLYAPGAPFDDALEAVIPHVRIAHVADMQGMRHRHLPIGEGDFPLGDVLMAMGRLGYSGPAVIEEFTRGYRPELYLERAVEFERRFPPQPAVVDVGGDGGAARAPGQSGQARS